MYKKMYKKKSSYYFRR